MRITVLRNLGPEWGQPYAEGQTVDADAGLAERLVASGLAVPVDAETAIGQPAPMPPATAAAAPLPGEEAPQEPRQEKPSRGRPAR